jgi:hypothetical protein
MHNSATMASVIPHVLSVLQCGDPYVFDSGHFDKLLSKNSKQRFVPNDELQIKVVEVGVRGELLIPTHDQREGFNTL